MNLSMATILFAAIVGSLIALPASSPVPRREQQVAHSPDLPPDDGCSRQTWPNFSPSCLRYAEDIRMVETARPVANAR
jgi:hypothetical protein